MMLKQHPTKASGLWRYLLIIPLTLSMLVYVACEKEAMNEEHLSLVDDIEQFTFYVNRGESINEKESYSRMQDFIERHPGYTIQMTVSGLKEPLKLSLVRKIDLPEGALELKTEEGAGTLYLVADLHTLKTEIEHLPSTDDNAEIPFSVIDQAPTFQSCSHLTAEERKKCTSLEVAKFVSENFNTKIASEFGLKGKQRIAVMFKIDKNGKVMDVRARAPHEALEDEAVRVINDLPRFIPGEHNGEAVVVPYSLPILFQVQE